MSAQSVGSAPVSAPASPVTVSQRLAEWLAARGVEQVFMVTGGGAMFLNHAFAAQPGMRCCYMHHEQACAMAAEAYSRISGKPAVVNVTTGPGGINALNGVFGAFTDSIPMIVVSGQVKRETLLAFRSVPGLRQLGDQEAPIVEMVRPITKGAWTIGSAQELAEVLPQAYALAISGRPGPVWIDIPIDIQSARDSIEFHCPPIQVPLAVEPAQLATVAEWLRSSHRPIILAGTGVRVAGAQEALLELVERAGIPLATAWTHDLIPSDHPLFAGRPGTIGTRAGNLCIQNADLVLVIGSRLNIRQVSYNWQSFARGARVVQVDVDPAELGKPLVKPDLAITADAAEFIESFQARLALGPPLPSFGPWIRWCQDVGRRFPAREESTYYANGINPYEAVERIFASLPERAVVACGNASACIIPFQVGAVKAGQRLFSNSGSASMGYELPAGIGAALAAPAQTVVCMCGDGSLQMNVQELQTLATLQLNVTLIVLANDGYLSIRQSHENFFGRVVGSDRGSGVQCPDFVAVARAYGIPAMDVHTIEELAIIGARIAEPGPKLIQIHVDRLQGFAPKLKSRMDEQGRFVTPELDDLFPFVPHEELEALRSGAQGIRSEKQGEI